MHQLQVPLCVLREGGRERERERERHGDRELKRERERTREGKRVLTRVASEYLGSTSAHVPQHVQLPAVASHLCVVMPHLNPDFCIGNPNTGMFNDLTHMSLPLTKTMSLEAQSATKSVVTASNSKPCTSSWGCRALGL